MRRILFRGLFVTALLLVLGIAWIVFNAPALPPDTDAVIDRILASELPVLVTGTTGSAMSGDVSIWYERIDPISQPRGTILLIQGAAESALDWPPHLYQPLVDAGYQVVRCDNRGMGMSDWMTAWGSKAPYTLEDMALDGLAVLDEVGVDRAHLVGISMGGMIGQRLAISHASRVATLTAIASSGYGSDPAYAAVTEAFGRRVIYLILRYGLIPTRRSGFKVAAGIGNMLRGSGDYKIEIHKERRVLSL